MTVTSSNTAGGQRILRREPKSSRAAWIRRVLKDRGETEDEFLARPKGWTNLPRRKSQT